MTQQSRIEESEIRSIADQVSQIRRETRSRDFVFIAAFLAAAGLSIFFVLMNSEYFEPSTILGVVWFLASAAVAAAVLGWARLPADSPDWTLRARFEHEIGRLRKQKALLDTVQYWLLAPLGIGVLMGVVLRDAARPIPWMYYAFCAAVIVVTYWLCHRESANRFGPLLDRMQTLHRDLTTP